MPRVYYNNIIYILTTVVFYTFFSILTKKKKKRRKEKKKQAGRTLMLCTADGPLALLQAQSFKCTQRFSLCIDSKKDSKPKVFILLQ